MLVSTNQNPKSEGEIPLCSFIESLKEIRLKEDLPA
jgi:hypothetical protein